MTTHKLYASSLLLVLSLLPQQGFSQTAVTLTVPADSSNLGAPLTLTATIANSAGSGKVTFFDGASIIGIKSVSAGVAALSTTLLSAGNHSLKAFYRDDSTSTTALSNVLAHRIKAKAGGAFLRQTPLSVGAMSNVVMGDFNGDGKVDLAFGGPSPGPAVGGAVSVMLGNGDGTFQTPVSYTASADAVMSLAVGDFDGDGNSDLASVTFTKYNSTRIGHVNVSVLLGNGDGTFRAGVFQADVDSQSFNAIVVGDFNNDGKADIIVGDSAPMVNGRFDGRLKFLPGNGDGTFGVGSAYSTSVVSPLGIADFSDDSKPDLSSGKFARVNPFLVLGNGSGTAQSPAFVSGDFNGDGKVDLAVGGLDSGAVKTTWVLLGNGDGTFQPAMNYPAGAAVATGDFNGDGVIDLLVSNATGTAILEGNGDGTFAPKTASNVTADMPLLVADFNGDGKADILTANVDSSALAVSLGVSSGASLTATGGANQFAPTGTSFALPLQVTALNNGTPLPGVTINFSAPTSGATATLSSQTAATNALGVASITAIAGFTTGSYVVTASYQGSNTTFALTNTAFSSITTTGGTPQSTSIGTAFAQPLQATVKDSAGNPVAGVTVIFGGPLSGAGIIVSSPAGAVTNAQGVASVTATANLIAGSYVAFAVVGTASASFQLTNTPGPPATLTAIANPQATTIGGPFPNPLQATVKDVYGNAISGVTVTFAAPGTGASAALSRPTAVTDAAGIASVTATANGIPGSYAVMANVGVLSTSFSLTNLTGGGVSSITAIGGAPQSALLNTAFAAPLQVGVKDSNGMPVIGATVTFSAPAGGAGATLSSASALTNALGVASVIATANNTAGNYLVTASSGGLSTTFSLTNLTPGQNSNLALGKAATQSSTLPGSSGPGAAVDGNTDGGFFNGSVTHTNADPNAWWQVDLGAPGAITSVSIWNRTDCCGDRLGDYWVFVSNTPFLSTDTPATLQGRAATFASHQTTAPNPSTIITIPGGMTGQYVRVQLSGTNNLSLAEVQVIGTLLAPAPTNLAQGRTATQSSTLAGYTTDSASAAVDGNTDGNFFNGSVTHTNPDTNAWWQVDLAASATVSSIVIWNRTDTCCVSRLSDYWVFVSDTPFLPTDTPATLQNRAGTFASHQTTAPTPSTTIAVGAQGRYVRVQLTGTNNLNLAEVQVFGTSAAPTNIAVGRTATQSSTLPGYATAGASSAVDNNTNGSFFSGSVTHTNPDTNAWWQLDLGASAVVSSIAVWNRTDCCSDRLNDYWVFVSDTPFLASDTPTTLQGRAGTFASHQMVAPSPSSTILVGAQGRYVRVQLSGTNNLSLAEVQVFGTGGGPVPTPTNLAQGKVAAESSTLAGTPSAAAGSAVDGITDGNFYDGSVTHTNPEPNPWWQVDLGSSVAVSSVVVFNRTDCCSDRLNDYWVFISDVPFLSTDTPATLQGRAGTVSIHQTTAPNPSTTIPAAAQGRYVRVQLSGGNVLSLAEVQVFGQ